MTLPHHHHLKEAAELHRATKLFLCCSAAVGDLLHFTQLIVIE